MYRLILFICLILFFASCAGYKIRKNSNPFKKYGISSVSVPVFLNNSVISNISLPFTKEILFLLNQFQGLDVKVGEDLSADSILIGVIKSRRNRNSTIKNKSPQQYLGHDDLLKQSIGNRKAYYVPATTEVTLYLDLVLIKDPSREIIKISQTDLLKHLHGAPRIVIDEEIKVTGSFSRELGGNLSVDASGVVNFTKNKKLIDKAVENLAISAAASFRELVLNAF